jgi:hypothetical protein
MSSSNNVQSKDAHIQAYDAICTASTPHHQEGQWSLRPLSKCLTGAGSLDCEAMCQWQKVHCPFPQVAKAIKVNGSSVLDEQEPANK